MSTPCSSTHYKILRLFLFIIVITTLQGLTHSTRIKGSHKYDVAGSKLMKYKYLEKFGVHKASNVYLYGNATVSSNETYAMVAFVPSDVWKEMELKQNRYSCDHLVPLLVPRDDKYFCEVYHNQSLAQCASSTPPSNFQYFIEKINLEKTEFWYLVYVFCHFEICINITAGCSTATTDGISIDYEWYIVNEDPNNGDHDPFTYQFPYDQHGFLVSFMIFGLLYAFLVPVHFCLHLKYTMKCQTPLLIWLFNFALLFEAVNILCGLMHYAVYSHNGYGVPAFNYMKGLLNLIGDWFLILVLILVGGGWMVTIRTVKWKIASFTFFGIYIFISVVYYICSVVYPVVHPWDTRHPLQMWAGGIYLTVRGLLLFYVWYQIYHIHRQEEKLQKLRLYRVLFVIFTAWFWYLPAVVAIVSLINPVVAWVVLINFMNIMNFLVNVIMTALFCPIWSHEYFQFDHIMNSKSSSVLLSSFGFSKQYTKIGDSYGPRVL